MQRSTILERRMETTGRPNRHGVICFSVHGFDAGPVTSATAGFIWGAERPALYTTPPKVTP